jgi:hypothetical protein
VPDLESVIDAAESGTAVYEVIAFLASPAACLIAGQTVVADAGITRRP